MKWLNTKSSWGAVSISLHWLSALVVIGLFALGLWMVSLSYYSEWYRVAPYWHKSIGVLFIFLVIFRLCWRVLVGIPDALNNHSQLERRGAKVAHFLLYFLLICMLPTGYFISTASGQSLEVFNWFSLPALIDDVDNLEDYAGDIHEWAAYLLISISVLHAAGALKHHFFDKDDTLLRMLGRNRK